MSIWSSYFDLDLRPPRRDSETAEDIIDEPILVDVATAQSWHNLIRLFIDHPDGDGQVLLTPTEARQLADALNNRADILDPR